MQKEIIAFALFLVSSETGALVFGVNKKQRILAKSLLAYGKVDYDRIFFPHPTSNVDSIPSVSAENDRVSCRL